MPIIIKDYTFEQNETFFYINLPLRGAKASNIDVLSSQDYIKVSYPPYYFECWFYANVDDDKCEIRINNGIVSIKIYKLEFELWPQLCHVNHENKDLMKLTRDNALNYTKEKAERKAKEKTERVAENKKIALKEQMKLEDEDRLRIKNVKEVEKKRASDEIEQFKQKAKKAIEAPPVEKIVNELEKKKEANGSEIPKSKEIFDTTEVNEVQKSKSNSLEIVKTKVTPDPRSSGTIQVKFTPRVFPTAARESQEQNEKEWLQNQMEARKMGQLPSELGDISQEEMNVDWLKEKASQFYKNENYQAAISVYNHAIRLFPKMPAFYSNRAACHFQVRNLMKCVEDCSTALELLNPPVESNLQNRIKSHVRRGTAFCELELYAEGLMDFEAALKLDPNNSELRADADNIRKIIQGN